MAADILDVGWKLLQNLPPRQLAGELMRLPAKRRLELILDHQFEFHHRHLEQPQVHHELRRQHQPLFQAQFLSHIRNLSPK